MHKVDALCLGHASFDLVFSVAHHPAPDEKSVASALLACGGGPVANAAVAVVRLGDTAFIPDEDTAILIETNIDNLSPEIYPYVIEQLLASGALDAFMIPIIMKKGRPGIMLNILAQPEKADGLLKVLYRETTTIGARLSTVARRKLPRRVETISTSFGPVQVKIIDGVDGKRLVPEFEECRRIAGTRGLPLREVREKLLAELNGG